MFFLLFLCWWMLFRVALCWRGYDADWENSSARTRSRLIFVNICLILDWVLSRCCGVFKLFCVSVKLFIMDFNLVCKFDALADRDVEAEISFEFSSSVRMNDWSEVLLLFCNDLNLLLLLLLIRIDLLLFVNVKFFWFIVDGGGCKFGELLKESSISRWFCLLWWVVVCMSCMFD